MPESRRQGPDPEDERQDEGDGAVGADAAVAHDGELALPGRAAAKAVGDVGEPILVQRAGRGDERGDGERRADEGRQAERLGRREREDAGEADDRAGDRRGPGDAIEVETGIWRRRQRQAGEEPQRVGDVASEGPLRTAHRIHRNMATASTPMTAMPASTKPHCRTSARAAPTSGPRSARIWLFSGAITKKA